ncbi:MAG: carbohydrate ABC transporter substrate-binding protein [Tissierellia bacterium]|nr:carbohydrate ABC transporter substrate-binding protein [Tissierellia bacterium]
MKNFKRVLALLLALIMVVSLTACGGQDAGNEVEEKQNETSDNQQKEDSKEPAEEENTSAGKTLKIAGLDGGYGTAGWEAVIAKFEELTGAKVEATFEKNIAEVVRPQILAGESPDILYNNIGGEGGLTETLIKEKKILDITDVLSMKIPGEDKTVEEKLLPGFIDTFMTNPYGDGKTYLAPLFYSPTGIWYNKALFTDGGGKYELPETFDEFFALGETAKADNIALFTYPTAGYFDGFTYSLINEVGGPELFNKLMNYDADAWKNEATPVFDTIGQISAYLEGNTVSQANGEGFTKNQQAVIDGKALFMPNGNWIVGEMKDSTPDDFEWGYMALPAINSNHGRYAYTFFEQAFVMADAEEPELAKEFIAYLYSDEAAKLFHENEGGLQPIIGADALIEDPLMQEVYGVYNDGVNASLGGFAAAPSVEGVELSKILFENIDSVMNGSKTVEEWQEEVVNAIQVIHDAMSN